LDENALMKEKLDAALFDKVQEECTDVLSIIVQTKDGLKDEDKRVMKTLGGKIKDNLYIIDAFSADIQCGALKSLILSPRVVKVYQDAQVRAV
jgi:hypothetical protein